MHLKKLLLNINRIQQCEGTVSLFLAKKRFLPCLIICKKWKLTWLQLAEFSSPRLKALPINCQRQFISKQYKEGFFVFCLFRLLN